MRIRVSINCSSIPISFGSLLFWGTHLYWLYCNIFFFSFHSQTFPKFCLRNENGSTYAGPRHAAGASQTLVRPPFLFSLVRSGFNNWLIGLNHFGGGQLRGFLFFSIFGSRFRFVRKIYFRPPFVFWWCLYHFSNINSGFSKGSFESLSSLYSSLRLCMLFPPTKRENLRHVQT